MSISHSQEKHIRAIRIWRCNNALFLVSSKAERATLVVPERDIQAVVLSAKLTPRQTVEVVCRKLIKAQAGPSSGFKYRDLLARAGLELTTWGDEPKLRLKYAFLFKRAFPSLEYVVPMLEACEGLSICIAPEPVTPTRLNVVKPSRQMAGYKADAPITAPPLSKFAELALRKFVMSRPVAGATVRELLKRANKCRDDMAERLTVLTTTKLALCRYGIALRYDESDLTSNCYAQVVDAELLARSIPELKNVAGHHLGGLFLS